MPWKNCMRMEIPCVDVCRAEVTSFKSNSWHLIKGANCNKYIFRHSNENSIDKNLDLYRRDTPFCLGTHTTQFIAIANIQYLFMKIVVLFFVCRQHQFIHWSSAFRSIGNNNNNTSTKNPFQIRKQCNCAPISHINKNLLGMSRNELRECDSFS